MSKLSIFEVNVAGPLVALLMGLAVAGGMPATVNAQALSSRVIELESNMENAMVYVDSVYIGRVSDQYFNVPWSARTLRLVPPAVDSWAISPISANLQEMQGESLAIELNFQYHYSVESVPYGAQVFVETPGARKLLGDTPILYAVDDPIRGMLLVVKSGYEPLRLTPGEEIWNQHYLTLEEQVAEELPRAFWEPGNRSRRWISFAAGGLAIASGILAVHYKTKADHRYARYEESGDPALRPSFERYDRYAGIALGTMQVGVGVLAIRLVLN